MKKVINKKCGRHRNSEQHSRQDKIIRHHKNNEDKVKVKLSMNQPD